MYTDSYDCPFSIQIFFLYSNTNFHEFEIPTISASIANLQLILNISVSQYKSYNIEVNRLMIYLV